MFYEETMTIINRFRGLADGRTWKIIRCLLFSTFLGTITSILSDRHHISSYIIQVSCSRIQVSIKHHVSNRPQKDTLVINVQSSSIKNVVSRLLFQIFSSRFHIPFSKFQVPSSRNQVPCSVVNWNWKTPDAKLGLYLHLNWKKPYVELGFYLEPGWNMKLGKPELRLYLELGST